MKTTVEQIDRWLVSRSETQVLEFKEAKNQYDNTKLFKYCVAIANEGGGHLLFGVRDKHPRKVVGSAACNDPMGMASKLFEHLGFRVDVEDVAHPDGRVVVFHIPNRPRGTAYAFEGAYLCRIGEELMPMSEDRLRVIFAEGRAEFIDLAAREDCSEEDVVRLLDTQAYFELRERPYPSARPEVLSIFTSKRFIAPSDTGYRITNLGALLFAKNLADFRGLDRKAVRVIVYEGATKAKVKGGKDITDRKGYAAGFNDLIDYIHGQLPASEEIQTALRKTTYAYPKKAIRELVGNAIVHQDLNETGTGVTVEIFDDRLEITNPGIPILPVDRFIDENQSRNEHFAATLRALRICDERGHGIDEVVSHIEAFQLPPYFCRLGTRHTTVVLSRYKQLRELTPDERIQAIYQHCCLRYVNNRITNNESIRERFGIEKQNSSQASRLLNDAVDKQKIRPLDPEAANKLMRYVPYWA
jgi:ATP-dependent DNA helicase RecG